MIETQRAYEMNSRAIETSDQMLQYRDEQSLGANVDGTIWQLALDLAALALQACAGAAARVASDAAGH